jgi:hypothetical protein
MTLSHSSSHSVTQSLMTPNNTKLEQRQTDRQQAKYTIMEMMVAFVVLVLVLFLLCVVMFGGALLLGYFFPFSSTNVSKPTSPATEQYSKSLTSFYILYPLSLENSYYLV